MRETLIRLIHEEGFSIRQASFRANIFYPTAKVINKIYLQENRIEKKKKRNRKKTCRTMACVKDKIKDDVLSAINLEDEEEQDLAKSSENKEKEDSEMRDDQDCPCDEEEKCCVQTESEDDSSRNDAIISAIATKSSPVV